MTSTKRVLAGAAVLALLATTACGGSDDPPKGAAKGDPAPAASWTRVRLPLGSLQQGTAVAFTEALAQGPGGPAIVAGTRTVTGRRSQAAVWRFSGGRPVVLDVPGDVSVAGVIADGPRTLAYGSTTTRGAMTGWLRTSTDRRSWSEVAVPAGLAKADARLVGATALSGGHTLLLALDGKHRILAQATGAGDAVRLPAAPGTSRYDSVEGAARLGRTVLVVARASRPNGATRLVGLRSRDGGATWHRVSAPAAPGADVFGIATSGGRFVATGQTSRSVTVPGAWSTRDGSSWVRESLPPLPRADPGWSQWLSAPVATGGTVYAAGVNSVTLSETVLKRSGGHWTSVGDTPDWTTPGAQSLVAPTPSGVGVARMADGKAQLGRLGAGYRSLGTPSHTGYWRAPALFAGKPDLTYQRQVVQLRPHHSWVQTSAAQVLQVSGDSASLRRIQPAVAKGLSDPAVASDPDGSTVVLGTETHFSDAPGVSDDTDVVGFHRGPGGGAWKRATGFKGPRTEQFGSVRRLGRTWVALGYDRADFNGGTHEYGAVWTSTDGRTWHRQRGGFDVSPGQNSYLGGACATSGGGIVVVGGVRDAARGYAPIAFRRTAAGWKRLDLGGLGTDLRSLDDCVSTGKVTLLQGSTASGPGLWRTTDLKAWDKVTIGGTDDSVGTVRPVQGGFAAAGGRYGGRTAQPVVWLSTDGRTWTSVAVASDRQVAGSDVLEAVDGRTHRLVVLLTGNGGPEVQRLDNFAALLDYAARQ